MYINYLQPNLSYVSFYPLVPRAWSSLWTPTLCTCLSFPKIPWDILNGTMDFDGSLGHVGYES